MFIIVIKLLLIIQIIFENVSYELLLLNCKTLSFSLKGFHLSATVIGSQLRTQFNVAVTFDRRRISSCNCTCTSAAYWCSHVVAVCLHRIHCVRK